METRKLGRTGRREAGHRRVLLPDRGQRRAVPGSQENGADEVMWIFRKVAPDREERGSRAGSGHPVSGE